MRPWSAVLRAPTTLGSVYVKGAAPTVANDAALTAHLAERCPNLVLAPLAVEPLRRWMALPSGGRRLASVGTGRSRLIVWEELLPRYAELQRDLVGHGDELVQLGALEAHPDGIAGRIETFLADPVAARIGRPDGPAAEEAAALRRLLPRVTELGSALDADRLGVSIQHDDLHDGNVLVRDGGARIFDWGDAAVSHPFATLVITRQAAADRAGLADDAPEIARLRDAYLEPWGGSRGERLASLAAVERLYPLMRGLAWVAAFGMLRPSEPHPMRGAPAAWMRTFLAAEGER